MNFQIQLPYLGILALGLINIYRITITLHFVVPTYSIMTKVPVFQIDEISNARRGICSVAYPDPVGSESFWSDPSDRIVRFRIQPKNVIKQELNLLS